MTSRCSFTSVSFAALEYVEGSFDLTLSPALSTASFPKLETVRASFKIEDNAGLSEANFPVLKYVNSFEATKNPLLAALEFPALTIISSSLSLEGAGLAALSKVSFPALEKIGSKLEMRGLPALQRAEFTSLKNVGHTTIDTFWDSDFIYDRDSVFVQSDGIIVFDCLALTAALFPALTQGGQTVYFGNNPALTGVRPPALPA